MFNPLFTKILDSSIWLESTTTRIVWITFLAMMDRSGNVALSSAGNVALRARVTDQEAVDAIKVLESPDSFNPNQDKDGRRIEKIYGGGWHVINYEKHRDLIKLGTIRSQTAERMRKHRAVTHVTQSDENVTPSEALALRDINPPSPLAAQRGTKNSESKKNGDGTSESKREFRDGKWRRKKPEPAKKVLATCAECGYGEHENEDELENANPVNCRAETDERCETFGRIPNPEAYSRIGKNLICWNCHETLFKLKQKSPAPQ